MSKRQDQKIINDRIKEIKRQLKNCKTKQEKQKLKNELFNKAIESKEIDLKESDKIGYNLPAPLKQLYMMGRASIEFSKPKKR